MTQPATPMLTERQRSALTRLVLDHQGRVRAFLCRFEAEAGALEELTQDVFIAVLSRCEDLAARPPEETGRYLRGVARNLVRLRWRNARTAAGRARPVQEILEQALEADLDREPDGSDERVGALRLCLERLSQGARDLVSHHFFQGTPLVQIARELRQSDAAVRMILFRIRRQLRICVEARLKEGLST